MLSIRPTGLIERALQLASSGDYRTITEISHALRKEGYVRTASELEGYSIRQQLRDLMKKTASNQQ